MSARPRCRWSRRCRRRYRQRAARPCGALRDRARGGARQHARRTTRPRRTAHQPRRSRPAGASSSDAHAHADFRVGPGVLDRSLWAHQRRHQPGVAGTPRRGAAGRQRACLQPVASSSSRPLLQPHGSRSTAVGCLLAQVIIPALPANDMPVIAHGFATWIDPAPALPPAANLIANLPHLEERLLTERA